MYCTCGAKTVEGAQFCHKCGRPLFEQVIEEDEPIVEAPPVIVAQEQIKSSDATPPLTEISFRNAAAVRVGFAVAGIGILFSNLASLGGSAPLQFLMFIILSMGSGILAVWLYKRRTGQTLSVKAGARLGWITGVFSFVLVIVVTTFTVAMVGPAKIAEAMKDPSVMPGIPAAQIEQILSNPLVIGLALIFSLSLMFAVYAVSSSVGGALGAKILNDGNDTY